MAQRIKKISVRYVAPKQDQEERLRRVVAELQAQAILRARRRRIKRKAPPIVAGALKEAA